MSKIKYEIFGNIGELSEYDRSGGDIRFCFVGAEAEHLCLCGRKYELKDGEVTVPLSRIDDGVHIPRLLKKSGQILLPLLRKSDRELSFPESEGTSHALSLRIARLNARILELEKQLSELYTFVHGTTCF